MNNTKTASFLAKPVWLRLDSSRFPFQKSETLEYKLNAALVSASFSMGFELGSDQVLAASGQGAVRVLFKKAQGASAYSDGSVIEDDQAFSRYVELDQAGKTLNEWNMALDKTTREWPAKAELPAPVLNPLLVLPAFISSWNSTTEEYLAQIVAGKRTHALKIRAGENQRTEDGLRIYRVSIKKILAPVIKDQWAEISWNEGDALEFHFDEKEKVVRTFRYRISPFGSLTASLKGVVRV